MASITKSNKAQKMAKIADFDYKDTMDGNTLMHAAVDNQRVILEVLDELVAQGAKIDEINHEGFLPIHSAICHSVTMYQETFVAAASNKKIGGQSSTTP